MINFDDPYGQQIRTAPQVQTIRYGFEPGADLRASGLEMDFSGLRFTVDYETSSFAWRPLWSARSTRITSWRPAGQP